MEFLRNLINIDSPSGYTHNAAHFVMEQLSNLGYNPVLTPKGAVRCTLGSTPQLAIAAHLDTLGAVVSGVNSNGTLRFSSVGGLLLPTFEGSYIRVYTTDGSIVTGTILLNNPSAHANNEAGKTERTTATMHVRLDAAVSTPDEVKSIGIRNGDFICIDPRYTETPTGFIKSHFLDNKAGCAILFEIARRISAEAKSIPVELFFSSYEEVGHGGSAGISDQVLELMVIDMGVVGDNCDGAEHKVSICAKDSSGPYDYHMRTKLVHLAEKHNIPHAVDVYPYYSSDGSMALRARMDIRVALIGPGVHASHGMERTTFAAITACTDLCILYMEQSQYNAV